MNIKLLKKFRKKAIKHVKVTQISNNRYIITSKYGVYDGLDWLNNPSCMSCFRRDDVSFVLPYARKCYIRRKIFEYRYEH
jgi:hypothetical protein